MLRKEKGNEINCPVYLPPPLFCCLFISCLLYFLLPWYFSVCLLLTWDFHTVCTRHLTSQPTSYRKIEERKWSQLYRPDLQLPDNFEEVPRDSSQKLHVRNLCPTVGTVSTSGNPVRNALSTENMITVCSNWLLQDVSADATQHTFVWFAHEQLDWKAHWRRPSDFWTVWTAIRLELEGWQYCHGTCYQIVCRKKYIVVQTQRCEGLCSTLGTPLVETDGSCSDGYYQLNPMFIYIFATALPRIYSLASVFVPTENMLHSIVHYRFFKTLKYLSVLLALTDKGNSGRVNFQPLRI